MYTQQHQQQLHNQMYPGQQPVMMAPIQAPGQKSEIGQVLAPMTTELGLPDQKINEYTKVFERHEVYNQKALFMLSET